MQASLTGKPHSLAGRLQATGLVALLAVSVMLSGPVVAASEVPVSSAVETGFPATALSADSLFRTGLVLRAEQGDCSAQFTLGQSIENRWLGFGKRLETAGGWYIKAANKGHAEAQYKAGLMYEHGVGTIPQSMGDAYLWFTLAASQGLVWGRSRRDEIARKMTAEQIAEAEKLVEAWEPDPASCEELAISIPADSPQVIAAAIKEVQRTWNRAVVAFVLNGVGTLGRMNAPHVQEKLVKFPPGVKLPTIIFIHGCNGFAGQESFFGKLARWGFAVIVPDSFARTGRVATCGSGMARPLRQEEIRYAVAQARLSPWVDADNLILMGHSEGGDVVTNFGGDGFKARVVSGTGCVGVSDSSPLLVVNSAGDIWLAGGDLCHRKADEYVRLPGPSHWPWPHPDAEKALIGFLSRHTGRDVLAVSTAISVPPEVVAKSDDGISLRGSGSVQDVYDTAKAHCETFGKASSLAESIAFGVHSFSCG